MWLMSTFEKGNQKKIFFVSTFLDWYSSKEPLPESKCSESLSN